MQVLPLDLDLGPKVDAQLASIRAKRAEALSVPPELHAAQAELPDYIESNGDEDDEGSVPLYMEWSATGLEGYELLQSPQSVCSMNSEWLRVSQPQQAEVSVTAAASQMQISQICLWCIFANQSCISHANY